MAYGLMAIRGAVAQAYDDAINGRGPVSGYRNACLALDRAIAQRDNDRHNARLLQALLYINCRLVPRVRAAMTSVSDNLARARDALRNARALIAANRLARTGAWLKFARATHADALARSDSVARHAVANRLARDNALTRGRHPSGILTRGATRALAAIARAVVDSLPWVSPA
jgi:hypothetical protein